MAIWEILDGETPIDISHVKVKGVGSRRQLNEFEAANILSAVTRYLSGRPTRRMAPFTLRWVKRLHREMFGDVWTWAGKFRREDLNSGITWYQIETSLENLLEDLKEWTGSGLDIVEQAAMLHHSAVQIHPFPNGNGRWARMLANILLKQNGHSPIQWPEDLIGSESAIRSEYLDAIRAADQGDSEPLVSLHRRYVPALPPPLVVRPQRRPPTRGKVHRPQMPPSPPDDSGETKSSGTETS